MKWFRVVIAGHVYSILAKSKRNAGEIALSEHKHLGYDFAIPRIHEVRNFQLGDKLPVSSVIR